MTVRFAVEARQDILETYAWYEQRRIGLGEEFLLCMEEAQERILRYPTLSMEVYEHYRRHLLRRFPYVLYYRIVNDSILIMGVFHTRRNPAFVKERLFHTNN